MSALGLSSPARKRAREDDGNAGGPEPNVIRSPDFYFNDGTIVLRTSSKTDNSCTLFRVHKSILALHCTVFRDMFGDGDAVYFNGASEQSDGVPLMQLHDETKDLDDFLRALHHPEFMQRHYHLQKHGLAIADFPKMYAPIMRLAKKYGAERLISLFSDAMLEAWPSDWETYIALIRSREAKLAIKYELNPSEDHDTLLHPDPAWTIHLAFDLDILDVLPCAYGALWARIGPACGVTMSTGHCAVPSHADESVAVLTAEEMRCLLFGSRNMASYVYEYASEHVLPLRESFSLPESDTHHCYTRFKASWRKLKENLECQHGTSNPFNVLRTAFNDVDLCQSCRKEAHAHSNAIALDVWEKLPIFFGLHKYGVRDDWGH